MKYAILIYDENSVNPDPNPDPAAWGQVMAEYNAFTKAINEAGINEACGIIEKSLKSFE